MKKIFAAAIILASMVMGLVQVNAATETENYGSWKVNYVFADPSHRDFLTSVITDPTMRPDNIPTYTKGRHGFGIGFESMQAYDGTYVNLVQTIEGARLKPNQKYKLKYDSRVYMAFDTQVNITGGVAEPVNDKKTVEWNEAWTAYEKEFTTDASGDDVVIEFRVTRGNSEYGGAKYYLDEIYLYETADDGTQTGENLIYNGGFEEDPVTEPAAPNVTGASAVGKVAKVDISWTNPADEEFKKARVYMLTDGGKELVGDMRRDENTLTVEGLADGTEYSFLITSLDKYYNESEGVTVTASTAAVPDVPKVSADDVNDVIVGMDESMEYKKDLEDWKPYRADEAIDLSGNHIVRVRYAQTELNPAGLAAVLVFSRTDEAIEPEKVNITECTLKNDRLSIKGIVANGMEANVTLTMKKKDSAASFMFIKQLKAAKDGSFSLNVTMSDEMNGEEMSGEYILKANSDMGLVSDNIILFYGSEGKRTSAIEKLNEVKSDSDIALMFDESSDYYYALACLGFRAEKYNSDTLYADTADGFILDMLKAGAFDANDHDKFAECVGILNILYDINNSKNGSELLNVLINNDEQLGLGFAELLENSKDKLIEWVLDNIIENDFDTLGELEDGYNKYIALYEINNSSYMTIEDTLKKYKDLFELDGASAYERYDDLPDKTATNKNIAVYLSKNLLKGRDDILSCLSSSYSDKKDNNNSDKPSRPAGGGGGGSSSGGMSAAGSGPNPAEKPEPQPEPQPEEEDEIFSDLDSAAWAKDAILYLNEKNIVSGMGDGSFKPNDFVTREQFVKMIVDAFGISADGDAGFDDVNGSEWFASYVNAAAVAGVVSGVSETEFGVGRLLTREDMSVLILKAAEYKGIPISGQDKKDFADYEAISEYAKASVDTLSGAGIINGVSDTEFDPKGNATRAQSAVIIYNVLMLDN